MIRTLKFVLRYDPANSRAIGYYATQQNAAYNHAVDVLNREPELPKRSGRNHPDALNKRITAWRQANRQTRLITFTSRAQRKPGKPTSACGKPARIDSNASPRPSLTARNPNTATCVPTAAPWRTAHESIASSA